jgi:hypothetical protein
MKLFNSASCATKTEALRPPRFRRKLVILTSITLWLLIAVGGLFVLLSYENTPALAAKPSALWPAESRVQRAPDRATLVMLVHPHCPCTRASIGELALLMAQSQGHLTAYVLFLKPAGFSEDWEKTDLWQSAAGIPGVTPIIDYDGVTELRRAAFMRRPPVRRFSTTQRDACFSVAESRWREATRAIMQAGAPSCRSSTRV